MGRRPWSVRLTVEECYALVVEDLMRAGFFSAQNGTNCTVTWTNGDGTEPFRVGLRLLTAAPGRLALIFCYDTASFHALKANRVEYRVEIIARPCRFGSRRYLFLCPVGRQGLRCNKPIRKLYLPPDGTVFGCRDCYNLTYKSCQTHNKTLDRLLKEPALIRQYIRSPNHRKAMIGVAAYSQLLIRNSGAAKL